MPHAPTLNYTTLRRVEGRRPRTLAIAALVLSILSFPPLVFLVLLILMEHGLWRGGIVIFVLLPVLSMALGIWAWIWGQRSRGHVPVAAWLSVFLSLLWMLFIGIAVCLLMHQ